MKFESLFGRNILTLAGDFHINLRDRGLHLIRGENDDDSSASSNGAGKSSVVDALCWCLFGVTARGAKGDAIVNRHAKKDAMAGVVIDNGASRYVIERHRKDTTHKNALRLLLQGKPGEPATDLSKGTDAETQKEVEKILGCSYEVFVAAVYSGQEIMPDLPRMTDRQLKSLIEESAGLERIEAAYEVARQRLTEAKGDVANAESATAALRTRLANAEIALSKFTHDEQAWEAGRAERVKTAEEAHQQADVALAAAIKAHEEADIRYSAAKPHIERIDQALAEHRSLVEADNLAAQEVTRAERAVNLHALQQAQARVAEIQAQIDNPDRHRLQPCKECGTVLESMTREDYIAHRQQHLNTALAEFARQRELALAQKQAIDAARAKRALTQAAIPDVTTMTAQRATLAKTLDSLTAAVQTRNNAKAARDLAAQNVKTVKEAANPYTSGVKATQTEFTNTRAQLEEAERKEKAAREKFAVANEVAKIFGPAGVRAQILDTVTPYLNDRTAEYLSVLSDGQITAVWTTLSKSASGDLKEKFSIEVEHAKGGNDFSLISGGEKRKVRLACALALQDLVASRATQPIDLWIGDEIDDALDPAGLERLMTILERKARERGTVLVISHSDLRDWIDNVTTVRKHAQWQSKVEGSLCT